MQHINLPEGQGNRPLISDAHLLQIVRDTAEENARNKRNFALFLALAALLIPLGWNYVTTNILPTPTEKTAGKGGVPDIVYPDKPKTPKVTAKPSPKVAPTPKKSEGEKWGKSALPTDADTKTEGVSIGEYSQKQQEIAAMRKKLEQAERDVLSKEPPAPEKSLSEMEEESEAAIKAEREGVKKPVAEKETGGVRWWAVSLCGFVCVIVWFLFSSAKQDERLHSALSFKVGDGGH